MTIQIDLMILKLHVERSFFLGSQEFLRCLVATPGIGEEEQVMGEIISIWAIYHRDMPI